jgi:2-polyprenyl-6-hydroxyphenyl methylase / 3-demethylubiquinone-9 3-methyltransferase
VLKPGGIFFYDTINRTLLARLVVVHLAEDVLRLLPRGTHDSAKFIRPQELDDMLALAGFKTHPPIGLGPRGLSRRLDFKFGRLPVKSILYMSHAVRV